MKFQQASRVNTNVLASSGAVKVSTKRQEGTCTSVVMPMSKGSQTSHLVAFANNELLPNECLEPGFPRKISAKTNGCTS